MREMLRENYGKSSSKISSGNQEVTDYDMMNDIITASLSDDWEPGQVKMSVEDHKNVINELSMLEVKNNDDQV